MHESPSVFAIDFGTSNSLLAAAAPGRVFPPIPLDPGASDPTVLRSALYFASLEESAFGSAAIKALVDNGFRGRLIRSIKRHLPSRTFTATRIGSKNATIEQLIAELLRVMRERACEHFQVDVTQVVLGRPARFSNDDADDALAEARLGRAAKLAGFREVSFCPEPVAAAYDFAADLDEPKVVLVADLGGGTSDFTLVRMDRRGFAPSDVLAVGGVAVAGDAIDGSLVRVAVAPEVGGCASYRVPFGSNIMPMPKDLIEMLCSPADLTLVDRVTVLRRITDIRNGCVELSDRPKLDKLYTLVEDGVGFALYDAVEGTKRSLSDRAEAKLVLDYPSAELDVDVAREQLEVAATPAVERMLSALDDTLNMARVAHDDVEILCVTGGTSRMPLVERALQARLPKAGLRRLKSFHSVVVGLAHHAERMVR